MKILHEWTWRCFVDETDENPACFECRLVDTRASIYPEVHMREPGGEWHDPEPEDALAATIQALQETLATLPRAKWSVSFGGGG